MRLVVVLTAALSALFGPGTVPAGPADELMNRQIDAIFSPLVAANSPGFSVFIRQGQQTMLARGYGVREFGKPAKIDPQTNFRLASCSKQFTAMAIMLLVHDGKLRYEETLPEIFPDFPEYGKSITIRSLLNHTSGLLDYEALMDEQAKKTGKHWSDKQQIQDSEVFNLLKQANTTEFAPGTKWAYSNSGYVLLGLVVGKVSGKSFGDFLEKRIFAPLKMSHTLAFEKGKNQITNRAYGHSKINSEWTETDQSSTSATLGDGGIYSSVEDLAKWDAALARHTLLSEAEMQPALTPVNISSVSQIVLPDDATEAMKRNSTVSYGFGWFLDPYHGHRRMWHYGDTVGFHTYVARFPDDDVTIIVLGNRTDLDPESLAARVANIFLKTQP
ncbi:MAG TPA: serine hydrolase domain-containing protein [Candidatus Saccharimonadales bacterium]|nr:serine hydrolase domain-containing protein [Candidatus Saccharimonadales bacterium]